MTTARRSRIFAAFGVIASALILAGPSFGAKKPPSEKAPPVEPPMRVLIVRSAQDGCEPNCPEWIAAQGKIMPGTLAQFRKVLRQLGNRNLPVLVHSGGGLADEAMAIGRLLRAKGLDVGVAKTVFTPCAPDASACRKKEGSKSLRGLPDTGFSVCASACAFVLAAGKRRFVRLPAFVGVHRGEMIQTKVLHIYRLTPYRADDGSIRISRKLIQERVMSEKHLATPEKTFTTYAKYFSEMGVEKHIMPMLTTTPNNGVHWLTDDELRSTRMATHKMSGEQLVTGSKVAGDGWTGPTPAAPTAGVAGSDCTLRGVDCPWQFNMPVQGVPARQPR
jgi:hypothetical protein